MKQYIKVLLVATFLIFANASIYAQPANVKSSRIETINGKQFYIHTVEKGQTLYGISKIYSISVDEILEHNPDASSGLKKGMELKIPSKVVVSIPNHTVAVVDSTIEHIVKSGETLYSIAKQYNVTTAQLKSKNPSLGDQLSIGQKVLIPVTVKVKTTVKNSEIVEKINQGVPVEKEPVISVDTLKNSAGVKAVKVEKSFRGYYEVALLIPLYLSESVDANNIRNLKDLNDVKSFSFIQFYEAFTIAIKQFESRGVKVTLRVYDVVNDTTKLNKILNSSDFANVDMIIGPFLPRTFKVASRWAMQNQVFIINPFSKRADFINNNPYVVKMDPSDQNVALKIADYCATTYHNPNVLLLHNNTDGEKKMVAALKQYFLLKDSKILVKEIIYNEKGINGVREKMVYDEQNEHKQQNIIISLFSKEAIVTNFVRRLYELKLDNVILIAPMEWAEYNNIETDYLEYLHLHYYDAYFVDYSDPRTIDFVDKFRKENNTEPQLDKYAFQGYDICTYFVGALIEYGYSWNEKLNSYHPALISSKIKLNRKDENSGFENSEIQLFQLKDYRFIKAE
jgi:LysM repeat protein/ABC-type branched-subunit amino acid transport system substrate-binding protein